VSEPFRAQPLGAGIPFYIHQHHDDAARGGNHAQRVAAYAALESGALGGLALDVLPVEPVPADSKLVRHPRVILAPHSAFYSVAAERELRTKAARNVVSWGRTGRPDYVVVAGTRRLAGA
jgi:D-3-phosphoglycerate dehydrogenase